MVTDIKNLSKFPSVIRVEDYLEPLMTSFLRERSQDLNEMMLAIENKDLKRVSEIGHKMKGVSASYGFVELGNCGKFLEEKASMTEFNALIELNKAMQEHLRSVEIQYVPEQEAI